VNNAGGSGNIGLDHIEDISEELWDQIVDWNLKSAFLCCRGVVPHMKSRRSGKIVNFSSMTARGTFGPRGTSAGRLPYAGAKSGIIGFTTQLAEDLGQFNINVNAVMPGLVLTELGALGPWLQLGKERTHRLWTLLRDLLQVILDQNGLARLRTPIGLSWPAQWPG